MSTPTPAQLATLLMTEIARPMCSDGWRRWLSPGGPGVVDCLAVSLDCDRGELSRALLPVLDRLVAAGMVDQESGIVRASAMYRVRVAS